MASAMRGHILTILFFAITLSSLMGCITPGYRDEMQPDGNTWKIAYGTTAGMFPGCRGGFSSDESCVEAALPHVLKRAEHVCSAKPYRIYACGRRVGSVNEVECIVQCKENPRQELIVPATTSSPQKVSEETVKKAKKCQSKGGVWVNDTCQINVAD